MSRFLALKLEAKISQGVKHNTRYYAKPPTVFTVMDDAFFYSGDSIWYLVSPLEGGAL